MNDKYIRMLGELIVVRIRILYLTDHRGTVDRAHIHIR
jgi:hypothetical protein